MATGRPSCGRSYRTQRAYRPLIQIFVSQSITGGKFELIAFHTKQKQGTSLNIESMGDAFHRYQDDLVRIRRSKRAVIASVVPALTGAYEGYVRSQLGARPLLVSANLPIGIEISVADPSSVGADRIANAVSVAARYRLPAIVVDLGSATNFDVVLRGPRYVGGVISPGIVTGAEELFRRGARLALALRSRGRR